MTALLSLIQFIAFNAAWFAAVWGAAQAMPWLGSIPALGAAALHLFLSRGHRWGEVKLMIMVTLFGVLLEFGFVGAGLVQYQGMGPEHLVPPVWLWALWLAFSTLPNGSLRWLKGRGGLQMLLGAIAGPLAYWGGAKLGAGTLGDPAASSLFGIGLAWFLAFPAIMLLADEVSPRRTSPAG